MESSIQIGRRIGGESLNDIRRLIFKVVREYVLLLLSKDV